MNEDLVVAASVDYVNSMAGLLDYLRAHAVDTWGGVEAMIRFCAIPAADLDDLLVRLKDAWELGL